MTSWWFLCLSMVIGVVTFGRLNRLGPPPKSPRLDEPEGGSPIRIVIPARNEAHNLGGLLDDLSRSRPSGASVVVVDDHSTDGTARLAAGYPFVEVRSAPPLPAGWAGKPWACHVGAADASAGTLIFLDADVRLRPGALESVVARQRRRSGVVSVQPYHDVPTGREQLSALFNVVSLMGAGAGGRRPNALFGPVICCAAESYHAVGGHASVRAEVVEDLALGRRFRDAGHRIEVLGGGTEIRFRMYPDGWRSQVQGWTKNMASGVGATPPLRAIASVVFVTGLLASVMHGWSLLIAALEGQSVPSIDVAALALVVVAVSVLLAQVGSYWVATPLALPLLVGFFVALVAMSTWKTVVRRQVTWRGRQIPIGNPRPAPAMVMTAPRRGGMHHGGRR